MRARGEEKLSKGQAGQLEHLVEIWSRQLPYLSYLASLLKPFSTAPNPKDFALTAQKKRAQEICNAFAQQVASKAQSLRKQRLDWSEGHAETLRLFMGLDPALIASQGAWLEEDPERMVVVIEPRLDLIKSFFLLEPQRALELLLHPSIVLLSPKEGMKLQEGTAQLELEYFAKMAINSAFIYWVDPALEKDPLWPPYKAAMIRLSTTFRAIKREALLSPDVLDHILRNALVSLENLDLDTLDLQCVPPVALCGAGPSLKEQLPWLKEMQDRLTIIAAGSSALVLQEEGIRIDFMAGICGFPDHYRRARRSKALEIPTFTSLPVHPGVLKLMQGPRVHLPGLSASHMVNFVERQMGYEGKGDDYGYSVTTAALRALEKAKAPTIFLLGLDLAYKDRQKYTPGIAKIEERTVSSSVLDEVITHQDQGDPPRRTTYAWLAERDWIEAFATRVRSPEKGHPSMKLFRLEGEGLKISGFEQVSQARAKKWLLKHAPARDVNQQIWQQLQGARDHLANREHLSQMFYAACDDLEEVEKVCSQLRKELLETQEERIDLEQVTFWMDTFDAKLKERWSYREFLHYVHWSVKSVQEKERFALKKRVDLSEGAIAKGLFTLLSEQLILLERRARQVARRLDHWIERYLESDQE